MLSTAITSNPFLQAPALPALRLGHAKNDEPPAPLAQQVLDTYFPQAQAQATTPEASPWNLLVPDHLQRFNEALAKIPKEQLPLIAEHIMNRLFTEKGLPVEGMQRKQPKQLSDLMRRMVKLSGDAKPAFENSLKKALAKRLGTISDTAIVHQWNGHLQSWGLSPITPKDTCFAFAPFLGAKGRAFIQERLFTNAAFFQKYLPGTKFEVLDPTKPDPPVLWPSYADQFKADLRRLPPNQLPAVAEQLLLCFFQHDGSMIEGIKRKREARLNGFIQFITELSDERHKTVLESGLKLAISKKLGALPAEADPKEALRRWNKRLESWDLPPFAPGDMRLRQEWRG